MTKGTDRSSVASRGRTIIPASVRRRHFMEPGDTLIWVDHGRTIEVRHLPRDVVAALRGAGRGERLLERLLIERARLAN